MKIAIGADHGGFQMKELIGELIDQLGHSIEDVGCSTADSVDYPEYAKHVCELVHTNECDAGILICGTGIGMSMAANRYRRIRAAVCNEEFSARLSREHNNSNVLCLGARVIGSGIAKEIVKVWLSTDFTGGRHQRRVDQFSD